MLGHQLLQYFERRHETRATLRQDLLAYEAYGIFRAANSYDRVDVRSTERLGEVLADFRPNAVINAVGIVKQRPSAKDSISSIEVNALFPHRLAVQTRALGARLVHVSTDCVFSGNKGRYTEDDVPDATDLYGRTKLLGEVSEGHCVTLRTSIVGLELARRASLIEWYLAQQGAIRGFDKAIYSGLTTIETARLIDRVLVDHLDLSGIWHVASAPISKYELLKRLTEKLGRKDVVVERAREFVCDRSLDANRFRQRTGYVAPSWDAMLDELAQQIRERREAI